MKNYLESQKKLNLEYFRALIAVAMADGKLMEEEKLFFHEKAEEFGLSVHSVQEMLSTELEDLKSQIDYQVDDIDFLTDIVAMAMIDGELHEKEYLLCVDLAKRKGFSQDELDKTVKELSNLINTK